MTMVRFELIYDFGKSSLGLGRKVQDSFLNIFYESPNK
jgi:hypothetical protein